MHMCTKDLHIFLMCAHAQHHVRISLLCLYVHNIRGVHSWVMLEKLCLNTLIPCG